MKKILSVVLAFAMILTVAATAFAAPPANIITEQQAKEIALKHAGYTADQVDFLTVKLELDDGRYEYDVEFIVNGNLEYDYTIVAATGAIAEYDREVEGTDSSVTPPSANIITEQQAKEIALKHAGYTEDQVRFTKVKLELDDGRYEYEIEFRVDGNTEYDYTIVAATGAIADFDMDTERSDFFSIAMIIEWIRNLFSSLFSR